MITLQGVVIVIVFGYHAAGLLHMQQANDS
ncbi:hypothetical protein M2387_003461 [Klebsiella sp. BIGb0407]|nr:hypothetical protein [Klebsiella sp. BIGb0407]